MQKLNTVNDPFLHPCGFWALSALFVSHVLILALFKHSFGAKRRKLSETVSLAELC